MSPTTTTGGHRFIPDPHVTEYLNSHHQDHAHLGNTHLILGSNHSTFPLHQQDGIHHQHPPPPEIGSTTTMWEDIASSIKKLDPDHADVLLVASSSSSNNILVPCSSRISQSDVAQPQPNNFSGMGEEPPQMIVTTLATPGDNSIIQEQQDCNNYIITSLPNNNASSMSLISTNNGDQSSNIGHTIIGGDMGDNNFSVTVSSMAPTSATTNNFSSMSFDSTNASRNPGIPVVLPHDQDHHRHQHIQQQDNSHSQEQQHDINQNPSNPSAITSPSMSSQISYQQINSIIMNQNSHPHPPHSNPHHIQLQSNAIRSNQRYTLQRKFLIFTL